MMLRLSLVFAGLLITSCLDYSMERLSSPAPQQPGYEPISRHSSSSDVSQEPELQPQQIDRLLKLMKKLRDHLRLDVESYETGKQIEAIKIELEALSEKILPRKLGPVLEEHYDQIRAVAKVQRKLFLHLFKKEAKTCEDGDTVTKRMLGHAYANESKINRFFKELEQKYGVFNQTTYYCSRTDNPLLE